MSCFVSISLSLPCPAVLTAPVYYSKVSRTKIAVRYKTRVCVPQIRIPGPGAEASVHWKDCEECCCLFFATADAAAAAAP